MTDEEMSLKVISGVAKFVSLHAKESKAVCDVLYELISACYNVDDNVLTEKVNALQNAEITYDEFAEWLNGQICE